MRETYFRAWDTYNESWADEYLAITEDGYVIEIKNDGTTEYWKNRFIIEFSTGLEDKNGKEICEGDIVRCYGDDRFIAPVIRHDESGGFCWVSCYKEECFIPESDEVEVIGNIHDNPELLLESTNVD